MFEKAIDLKARYRAGEQIVGVATPVTTDRDTLRKLVDSGPYDFVSVDSQHSPLDEPRLAEFCMMAEEEGVNVHFRIKHTRHTYMVGNYLDLGPCGVEVPQTELESTVDEAVQAFYFPPDGGRSFGGRARRGAGEVPDPFEYGPWWNTFGVLWMQIESVEAVTRAHILARAGVDCLSFGPTDLTYSLMGHPNHWLKTVDDCVAYVCKSLEGTGVAVCHRSGTSDVRQKYIDMGVTVFIETPKA